MAGGRGSRMNLSEEKLMLTYKKPMILHVANALKDSNCFSKIIFVTSPNSPKTVITSYSIHYTKLYDIALPSAAKTSSFDLASPQGEIAG